MTSLSCSKVRNSNFNHQRHVLRPTKKKVRKRHHLHIRLYSVSPTRHTRCNPSLRVTTDVMMRGTTKHLSAPVIISQCGGEHHSRKERSTGELEKCGGETTTAAVNGEVMPYTAVNGEITPRWNGWGRGEAGEKAVEAEVHATNKRRYSLD